MAEEQKQHPMPPEELRAVLDKFNLTTNQFGAICGVAGMTVRRWVAPVGTPTHRAIPGPAERLAREMESGGWPEKRWRKYVPERGKPGPKPKA